MRRISYCEALREAQWQEMERDPSVFVYGVGVPTHAEVFGTVTGLADRFGPGRCMDTPISEAAMTGFGLGAAIGGLRPIHIHIRVDFLLLAMSQLVNQVSPFIYSTCGGQKAPLTIRAIVGRGWGQGWQHSKSLHSAFAHVPGLKVVLPTRARDAKGLLTAAIRDDNPVLVIEHRWLYWAEDEVPEEPYATPLEGGGAVLRPGSDLTIVATSWMAVEALRAAEILARSGVDAEVVDPQVIAPFDDTLVLDSAGRTGRCMVADNDWTDCGFGAEVAARVSEACFGSLRAPVRRVGWPMAPCPTARCLEDRFYPNAATLVRMAETMLDIPPADLSQEDFYSHERHFRGPF